MNLTVKEQQARKRLCLALDNLESIKQIQERIEELSPYVGLFKIGKESFTRFGPEVVRAVQDYGSNVFLDLKYHDIPNTVKGACKAAAELGVYIINVHASGGAEMMRAGMKGVIEGTKEGKERPYLIAVTVLTSIKEETMNDEMRVPGSLNDQVLHLARQAQEAGLDGIVCSAQDLSYITQHLPQNFMYVTPGIKGPSTDAGADQARVMTPYNAIKDGSSILVVGRAITNAQDRKKAAYEVLQNMAKALE